MDEVPPPAPICLPTDVVSLILCLLDGTSVLRLRCVSKLWLSFIDSPYFINFSRKYSIESRSNASLILVGSSDSDCYCVDFDKLESDFCDSVIDLNNPVYERGTNSTPTQVIGSSNGLIALLDSDTDKLIYWNPFTSKYIILQLGEEFSSLPPPITYGFGYDSVNDDYKLVSIATKINFVNRKMRFETGANVYSLKYDSSSTIAIFLDFIPSCYTKCAVVNNALHWLMLPDDKMYNDIDVVESIIVIDLGSQKFREVGMPSTIVDCRIFQCRNYGHCHLYTLGESLSLVHLCGNGCDIWLMKVYGLKKSWIKLLSLKGIYEGIYFLPSNPMVKPLAYSKNGDRVLLEYERSYYWYDLKGKSYKNVTIPNISQRSFLDANPCVRSLVSLDNFGNDVYTAQGRK